MTNEARGRAAKRHVTLPQGEPMGIEDIHDALVIREGDIFLLMDQSGNVPVDDNRGLGLYHADTRHLSGFNFYFHTPPPLVLLSTAELGFGSEHVLTNPQLRTPDGQVIPRGTVGVRRQRVINGLLEETIQVTNYHSETIDLELHVELAADFADIFEVRGFRRKRRGTQRKPVVTARRVTFQYRGVDGRARRTVVSFAPTPHLLSASGAVFRVTLDRRQTWTGLFTVSFGDGVPSSSARRNGHRSFENAVASYERWSAGCTQVFTDNEFFNKALERSLKDLRMLWDESEEGVRFPAAGTPWFDALFGRDSLMMGLQTLAFRPQIARETLKSLARWQGKRFDPWRDEEPGKIPHELRQGEVSRAGELPYRRYYGSVDSTLLFLLLIAEYYAWTGDRRLLRELRPHLLAAVDWLHGYADSAGDGYVDYAKHSELGLVNQGWKDSSDAIMHADGSLAEAPIALVEVQGYAYAAKRRLGPALEAIGLPDVARKLAREARILRRRFLKDFWLPDEQFYALALDDERRPCAVVASNVGHALWSGIVTRERAAEVVERMLANDLFSGWGIRTLSRSNPRYSPLGYHLGAVWPHDNAIAAFGFKMYGFEEEMNEVATALFDAAVSFPYYRLPELFSGDARTAHHAPVPYPVACRPQGWAAGAFPMLLHAVLGLRANAPEGVLQVVRPRLPYWLHSVQVRGLRVGRGSADLLFTRKGQRTRVEVLGTTGGLRVSPFRHWPL
jgi:glycogen debranching enzyme